MPLPRARRSLTPARRARTPARCRHEVARVLAAVADLVWPASCAGCGEVGTDTAPLCAPCAASLTGLAAPRWPTPAPPGLPVPWAVAAYDGPVRSALLAYKEDGRVGLAGPFGAALGRAVVAAVRADPPEEAGRADGPVLLVPVPSTPAAVRRRGGDPLLRLARRAGALARTAGVPADVAAVLVQRRRLVDQSGLGSEARAANLRGALELPARLAPRVHPPVRVVLVDDVVTTGATLAEAARALRAGGARVSAAAVVAATPRRG